MINKEPDYVVCMHFLPAIVNGDMSGLEDSDIASLEAWIEEHGDNYYPLFDEEFPDDLIQYLAKCDITGMIGWCCEIIKT